MTLFDEKPDDALFERLSGEFRATLGVSGPGQPLVQTVYEIATEV